jgi:hypothetical protein
MKPALALLICFGLAAALYGQSRSRQTFEGVVTLPNRNAPPPPASLSGTVVAEATGQPLPGAMVTLSQREESPVIALLAGEKPGPVLPPVRTDAQGKFLFQGIVPGASHNLSVQMDGFLTRTLGEQMQDGRGTWLTFAAAEKRDNFTVAMTRSARIEGRVVNQTGESLTGIPVRVFDPNSFSQVAETLSAQDGSYRLQGFSPGRYILAAGSPASLKGQPPRSFVTPITVTNTNLQTQHVSLESRGAYNIRGEVSLPGANSPPPQLSITVKVPSPPGGSRDSWLDINQPYNYSPQTGTFEIPRLLPGVYLVNASVDPQRTTCASAFLVISAADVTGLELTLESCFK